ncbi:MAG: YcaO-like family protein, partial [Geminicoccales bacterium]
PGAKTHRSGTHRTVAPVETVARLLPLMPAMGITRVANVTGLDRIGLPVVMVTRPNARSIAVSQGKGLDLDAARASGLMEAAELHHAERIGLPLRLGSHDELRRGHRLVEIEALPRLRDDRFRPDLAMLWIEGRDLISGEPVWLPYEVVHTNATLPLPPGSGCFAASSNGLASGNHVLEAITHGICEVIERDASSLWHRQGAAGRARTRLDLGSIDDPACREVLARLEDAELRVAVWDVTSDLGIAAFRCMLLDERRPQAHPGLGAGCHLAREVALLRALCEAVQVRMTYISGARDDLSPDEFTRAAMAEKLRKARALMRHHGPMRDFRDAPSREFPTFAEDVAWLLERLEAAGMREVAVVDLTRPELGPPVVRVVIPGLEAPDDRDDYVPGPRALAIGEGGR